MNINILGKNMNLAPGTHMGVKKDLENLCKFLDIDTTFDVRLNKLDYNEIECRISTLIDSSRYNIKVTRETVYGAVDAAVKALKEKVLEDRHKLTDKKMSAIYNHKEAAEKEVEEKDVITKIKDIHLTPISDAEAIEELNNSRHDVYMYLDEATLEVKGVYKRSEGYGLINFKTV